MAFDGGTTTGLGVGAIVCVGADVGARVAVGACEGAAVTTTAGAGVAACGPISMYVVADDDPYELEPSNVAVIL